MSKPKVSREERGERPTFRYSDEQLAEIRAALAAPISETAFVRWVEALHMRINSPPIDINDVIALADEFDRQDQSDIKVLADAIAVLQRREIEANEWGDPFPEVLPAALTQYRQSIEARLAESVAARSSSPRLRRRGNAYRHFQSELGICASKFWTAAGGEISYGISYRAFFDAVMKPVLSRSDFKRFYGVEWNARAFSAHVEAARKAS
jgi:hypothetical protein